MATDLPGAFEAALDELSGIPAAADLRHRMLPQLGEHARRALDQFETTRYRTPPHDPGRTWVHPHTRSGRQVDGYWRTR